MNEKLEKLNELHKASTQGTWGPTTRPPYNHAPGDSGPRFVVEGERGEPTWGAIVSDQDGVPGVDHARYAVYDFPWYWEPGTDIYGGTMIGESFANPANGQFAAEAHNLVPNMLLTINTLRVTLLEAGVKSHFVDGIIDTCMGEEL